MQRRFLILSPALAIVAILYTAPGGSTFSQEHGISAAPPAQIALTHLSDPVYPPLARQVRISGEVNVLLNIRRDGSVESAVIVSGHPLLQQAALNSARQSQFECKDCTKAFTSYPLKYTFQLTATNCCSSTDSPPDSHPNGAQVTQTQNHVTVVDRPVCFCDAGGPPWKVRSIKCLYLWKCVRGTASVE